MAEHANISSIDALEAFRTDMIQYTNKAKVALEDAEGQVRRMRSWLDVDRTGFWQREMKLRTKQLDQVEAELYSAELTRPLESHAFQKMAVLKAKRRLEEAEEKIRLLNRWRQTFDNLATPLLRRLDPMFFVIGQDMPKGIHMLGESIKALQAYAERMPSPKSAPMENPAEGGAP